MTVIFANDEPHEPEGVEAPKPARSKPAFVGELRPCVELPTGEKLPARDGCCPPPLPIPPLPPPPPEDAAVGPAAAEDADWVEKGVVVRDRGDDSSCDEPPSCCCAPMPMSEAKFEVEDEAEDVCRALPDLLFKVDAEGPQAKA